MVCVNCDDLITDEMGDLCPRCRYRPGTCDGFLQIRGGAIPCRLYGDHDGDCVFADEPDEVKRYIIVDPDADGEVLHESADGGLILAPDHDAAMAGKDAEIARLKKIIERGSVPIVVSEERFKALAAEASVEPKGDD